MLVIFCTVGIDIAKRIGMKEAVALFFLLLSLASSSFASNSCTEVFLVKKPYTLFLDPSLSAGENNANIVDYYRAYETNLSLYDIVMLLRSVRKTDMAFPATPFFRYYSDYFASNFILNSTLKKHHQISKKEIAYLLDQIKNQEVRSEISERLKSQP